MNSKAFTFILYVTTLHATWLTGYSQGELDSSCCIGVCKTVFNICMATPIALLLTHVRDHFVRK